MENKMNEEKNLRIIKIINYLIFFRKFIFQVISTICFIGLVSIFWYFRIYSMKTQAELNDIQVKLNKAQVEYNNVRIENENLSKTKSELELQIKKDSEIQRKLNDIDIFTNHVNDLVIPIEFTFIQITDICKNKKLTGDDIKILREYKYFIHKKLYDITRLDSKHTLFLDENMSDYTTEYIRFIDKAIPQIELCTQQIKSNEIVVEVENRRKKYLRHIKEYSNKIRASLEK
jgi:hypothetical protein